MDKSTKLEPLNMHGHANTWEEELLETARECAELRAENDEMLTKIVELLDERDELRAENEQLTYLLTLAREEHEQHKAEIDRLRNEWNDERFANATEMDRLRTRLVAAERLIEVVRAREIGTAGGVGAAFEAYDALCQT